MRLVKWQKLLINENLFPGELTGNWSQVDKLWSLLPGKQFPCLLFTPYITCRWCLYSPRYIFLRRGYFSNQLKLFSIICKNLKIFTYCTENLFRLDLLIWTTWSFRQFIYLYLVAYTWIFTLYHPNTRLWLMTLAASVWGLR